MKKSLQLKAKKAELLKKAGELLEQEQTDDTRKQIDDLQAQATALDADIARAESVEAATEAAEAEPAGENNLGAELQSFLGGDTSALSATIIADLNRQILILMEKKNPMRELAHSVTCHSGIYEKLVSTSDITATWVSEKGARNPGKSTTLETVEIRAGQLFASVPYTQWVLDMSAFDLVGWAQREVTKAFAGLERKAMFIDGDGVDNKPVGLLTHVDKGQGVQKIDSVVTAAKTINADDLIHLTYKLETEYLDNACWIMSRETATHIRKLKYTDNKYVWVDGLEGSRNTLLGYPIHFVDEMPSAETAGALPIIFGDISQAYTIVDHETKTKLERDPVTKKPHVLLDYRRYCGGNVVNGQAVKVLKIYKA